MGVFEAGDCPVVLAAVDDEDGDAPPPTVDAKVVAAAAAASKGCTDEEAEGVMLPPRRASKSACSFDANLSLIVFIFSSTSKRNSACEEAMVFAIAALRSPVACCC